jgi:hypothetical protein
MRNHNEIGVRDEFVENVASDIQHGMLAHCSKIQTWILIVCWGIGQLFPWVFLWSYDNLVVNL